MGKDVRKHFQKRGHLICDFIMKINELWGRKKMDRQGTCSYSYISIEHIENLAFGFYLEDENILEDFN